MSEHYFEQHTFSIRTESNLVIAGASQGTDGVKTSRSWLGKAKGSIIVKEENRLESVENHHL